MLLIKRIVIHPWSFGTTKKTSGRAAVTWNTCENIGTEDLCRRLRHIVLQPTAV